MYKATLTPCRASSHHRPGKAALRNPPEVWGEGEGGEPEGLIVDQHNLEAALLSLGSNERCGFELLDLLMGRSPTSVVCRLIRFDCEATFGLLDERAAYRAAGCLEQRGFTFRFAYQDEAEIDQEDNYRRFFDWMLRRGRQAGARIDVPDAELTIYAAEGGAA